MYHGDGLVYQEQELESKVKYSRKTGHRAKSPGCTPTLLSPQVGYQVKPRRFRQVAAIFSAANRIAKEKAAHFRL